MEDIELVIKIPETTYKQIQELERYGYYNDDMEGKAMRRIANGIPLPKAHEYSIKQAKEKAIKHLNKQNSCRPR